MAAGCGNRGVVVRTGTQGPQGPQGVPGPQLDIQGPLVIQEIPDLPDLLVPVSLEQP